MDKSIDYSILLVFSCQYVNELFCIPLIHTKWKIIYFVVISDTIRN